MAKTKKGKTKPDEKPAPTANNEPEFIPASSRVEFDIPSDTPHPTAPNPTSQWETNPAEQWNNSGHVDFDANHGAHHDDDNGAWPPMPQEAQGNQHTWGEPANSLLQPPPNQPPNPLETIPEQESTYGDSQLSYRDGPNDHDSYSGSFSSRHENPHDYQYASHDSPAAQGHSAMRSPVMEKRVPLNDTAPPSVINTMQTQTKMSSASEAARKLEQSRRAANIPQISNTFSPANHHGRAHQLGAGGHTPISVASVAAAIHESNVNRHKVPKSARPPKPTPQPDNPTPPGKTVWTYPKPFTPQSTKPAARIPTDPSWIMTGGNAWSNKHRVTKSTSAVPGPSWSQAQAQPQNDMRGWNVDPRQQHQTIPSSQFHGVHSPQHQKHQSYPNHPMQQHQVPQKNDAERWPAWRKEGHRDQGHGSHGGQGVHGGYGGQDYEENFDEEGPGGWGEQAGFDDVGDAWGGGSGSGGWKQQSKEQQATAGGYDEAATWGQGGGQGTEYAHMQGFGRGQSQGQGQGNAHGQGMQGVSQQLNAHMLAQQLRGHQKHGQQQMHGQQTHQMHGQGRGGQHKEFANASPAAKWDQGGSAGAWGSAKGEVWGNAAGGGDWGDAAGGGDWGDAAGDGDWDQPMHAGHSNDWSQYKTPSHHAKDPSGTKIPVFDQQRAQIANFMQKNGSLPNQTQLKQSNMTTAQHQMAQQQAAMLEAQLAAYSGGANLKATKVKVQQPGKAKVWEEFGESWGEDDDDGDDGNRKVHFSPKTSELWGASPHSIPSRTLATTTAQNGIATTPLNLSSDVRFVESRGAAFSFVSEAFFGNSRLARERIHWLFPVDKDPRVATMHQWVQKMSYNLGTYGLVKFLEKQERGALFVNVLFHMQEYPKEPALDWLTFNNLQGTMDKTLQESVAFYDPARLVILFIYLPSQSGKSVAVWRVKINVPDDARSKYQAHITAASKLLRDAKDYVVMLDEAPKPSQTKAAIKASQLRKTKTIKGGKVIPAKNNKVLPNGQILQGKKKRKWWKFFLS